MAARARLLQLGIAVVNLAILGLAFTSIWPFPHGDFQVHLPTANEVTWTYVDGVVVVHAPYWVDNGGFYDVDDLAVSYSVSNSTKQFAAQRFDLGELPAGHVTPGSLDFTIDLVGMYQNNIQWLIFNDDILDFHIEVSCHYTMRLVQFDASYISSVVWNALIESWGVDKNVTFPSLQDYAGEPVLIHYWLNTSELLSSIPPATLNVTVLGDAVPVAWVESAVQVGGHYDGTLQLALQPSFYGPYAGYSLVYSIDVAGFHFSQTRSLEVPTI